MGEVVATIKLMPESPDVDMSKIKAKIQSSIPKDAELYKIEEEPVAFGLIALNVMVVVDDAAKVKAPTVLTWMPGMIPVMVPHRIPRIQVRMRSKISTTLLLNQTSQISYFYVTYTFNF